MRRSMLFIPGNTPNLVVNSPYLGADAIIFDLEDAVSPGEKDAARILVRNTLRYLDLGGRETIVRINAIDTDYWQKDVEEMVAQGPDLLMLPKSSRPEDVQTVDEAITRAEERVGEIAAGVCAAYGCRAETAIRPDVPATVNSPAMTALARRAAAAVAGAENLVCPPPDMGSEDFAVLAQSVPAFFYWLGSGAPGRENPCWHSERFCAHDGALPLGAALLAQSALTALAAR